MKNYEHYRKTVFIHRSKLMNIPSKLMSICYICRLTDKLTDEPNSNELKSTYSSVLTNITIYSSVMWNRLIYPVIFVDDVSPRNVMRRGWGRGSNRWPVIFIGELMNIATFHWFGHPSFGETDWTRNRM
jgi:hypothetical protein